MPGIETGIQLLQRLVLSQVPTYQAGGNWYKAGIASSHNQPAKSHQYQCIDHTLYTMSKTYVCFFEKIIKVSNNTSGMIMIS
jgi:hypothetical protein